MKQFLLSILSIVAAAGIAAAPVAESRAAQAAPAWGVVCESAALQEDIAATIDESEDAGCSDAASQSESLVTVPDEETAETNLQEEIATDFEAKTVPAMMPRATPSVVTNELAQLLATNQADSIMGSLGLVRSEDCSVEVGCFTVSDFNTTQDIDYNYAMLWQAVYDALEQIANTDGTAASCAFADGAMTVLR